MFSLQHGTIFTFRNENPDSIRRKMMFWLFSLKARKVYDTF